MLKSGDIQGKLNKRDIIVCIIAITLLSMVFNITLQKKAWEYEDLLNKTSPSPFAAEVHPMIYINGNSGWVDFKNTGNCTGQGTYAEPYVIEDLVIDAGGSGSCILIEYSDVYFRIENCTLYNSSSDTQDGGIKLYEVYNGNLINNNVSQNGWGYLGTYGIFISCCDNLLLFNNTVSKNSRGINVLSSNKINVTQNTISYNSEDGLYFDVNNSIASNNMIFNNSDYAMSFYGDNTIVLNNTISNSQFANGIQIAYANNNTISMNTISNNRYDGIKLSINCSDNLIFYNNLINNSPNAFDDESNNQSNNQWDNGSVGNYWGDYFDKFPEAKNIEGIWNIPYEISGSSDSVDRYPLVKQVNVLDNVPIAGFNVNATSIYEDEWIQFTDETHHGYVPYTYEWDFGDGSLNSIQQNPIHQFDTNGTFWVTLTVYDITGNSNSTTLQITVFESIAEENNLVSFIDGYNGLIMTSFISIIGVLWISLKNHRYFRH